MSMIPLDDVLRVLRFAPDGLTSREVADRLGLPKDKVSLRLSKMASYGHIDREYRRGPLPGVRRGHRRWSVFRMKERVGA